MLRAEQALRVMPYEGVPARGSVKDLIICELLMRERRRKLLEQIYLGRILAAGFNIPEAVFRLLTTMLSLEITQENYIPKTVDSKKMALETLVEREKEMTDGSAKVFQKLQSLDVEEKDLRPATAAEIEDFKRKLRQRHMKIRK